MTDPGSSIDVEGGVRSNGPLSVSGSNNTFGPTTYGGPNGCNAAVSGSGNTFDGSTQPVRDALSYPWPEPYFSSAPSGGVCDFTAASFGWSANGTAANPKVIPSGTYCASSQISISGSHYICTCTFIAPKISLSGSSLNLSPYYQDLLIDYYDSGSDFNIAGSGDTLKGTIFVPFRRVSLSGSSSSSFDLFLEGNTVSISGSGWTMTGYGPSMGYSGSQLIE